MVSTALEGGYQPMPRAIWVISTISTIVVSTPPVRFRARCSFQKLKL
jgi:hypothetical protein